MTPLAHRWAACGNSMCSGPAGKLKSFALAVDSMFGYYRYTQCLMAVPGRSVDEPQSAAGVPLVGARLHDRVSDRVRDRGADSAAVTALERDQDRPLLRQSHQR